eukprot:3728147-Rhodomonas_salina.7
MHVLRHDGERYQPRAPYAEHYGLLLAVLHLERLVIASYLCARHCPRTRRLEGDRQDAGEMRGT